MDTQTATTVREAVRALRRGDAGLDDPALVDAVAFTLALAAPEVTEKGVATLRWPSDWGAEELDGLRQQARVALAVTRRLSVPAECGAP